MAQNNNDKRNNDKLKDEEKRLNNQMIACNSNKKHFEFIFFHFEWTRGERKRSNAVQKETMMTITSSIRGESAVTNCISHSVTSWQPFSWRTVQPFPRITWHFLYISNPMIFYWFPPWLDHSSTACCHQRQCASFCNVIRRAVCLWLEKNNFQKLEKKSEITCNMISHAVQNIACTRYNCDSIVSISFAIVF